MEDIDISIVENQRLKVAIIRVFPQDSNREVNWQTVTVGEVSLTFNMGRDEEAINRLESVISSYIGNRPHNRYNGIFDPYSVAIVEPIDGK